MKKVKNTKQEVDSWTGQQIEPGEYYTIESSELGRWQNDSKVLSDIGSGNLVMNDGSSDIVDVATAINFLKDERKKNAAGEPIIAPTFEDIGDLTTIWKGNFYEAAANSLSLFDELVTSEQKLREGWFKVLSNGHIGDYIECSIVDKDDVLGLFASFGLVVGVDVLELKKYVRTEYIAPEDKSRQIFNSNAASDLMPGLYVRVHYLNVGAEAVKFTVTRKYHEA